MILWAFYALSAVAFLGALGLVFHPNPMVSGLCMAVAMLAVAGLYALLHVPFLGFFQAILYAGAVMVMVLYIVMALGWHETGRPAGRGQVVGTVLAVGLFLVYGLRVIARAAPPAFAPAEKAFGTIRQFGSLLVDRYAVPFELASLVLLAAMVGAVVLARRVWE